MCGYGNVTQVNKKQEDTHKKVIKITLEIQIKSV